MSRLLRERAERRRARETWLEGPDTGFPVPSANGAGGLRIAVGYPNRYALGMSNVGFQAVHRFFHLLPDTVSERFFLPDRAEMDEYRRTGLALRTLESGSPVRGFDVVAFSITFEPDLVHLVEMLQLAGIPPLAADRTARDPLVIAGGPVTFLNPEPLAPFVDAFGVGEAEALLPALTDVLQVETRDARLRGLAEESGFYVPATHEVEYAPDGQVLHRRIHGGHPVVRARMGKDARTARPHTDRIGLVSTAVGAHREIVPLVSDLRDQGFRVSVSSIRFEDVRDEFARPLAESGGRTVAIAPEVGTDRLRKAIHKRVTNDEILDKTGTLLEAGVENLKLYLMVGLPGETDTDVEAIVPLVRRIRDLVRAKRRGGRTIASVNPFIPKPGTPFQWRPMAPLPVLNSRIRYLQRELGALSGVEAHCKSPRMERLQALLALGDRRLAPVILALAQGRGLNRSLKDAGLSLDAYLYRQRDLDEELPWGFMDTGMKDSLLKDQLAKADRLVA